MLYAVICTDKPGALAIRKANREQHLAHIRASSGAVEQAGPLLGPDGEMVGSLILFRAKDLAAVELWCEEDPYAKAGLFESVVIRPWNRVIG